MDVQVLHATVHSPEQVREIMTEAWVIAEELTLDDTARFVYFRQACELLGARLSFPVQQGPQPLPADLAAILNGKRV